MTETTVAPERAQDPARSQHSQEHSEETEWALTPEDLPNVDHLITEDDTPVDNWYAEKQMRLLTEPLYTSWPGPGEGHPFIVAANVGLYASVHDDPLVPDVMLSLDVEMPDDWWEKGKRVYFVWEFGKPPDVVIEIVSNQEGGERDRKMARYARMGIAYYVIYDPQHFIQDDTLVAYQLSPGHRAYQEAIDPAVLPGVELGLTLWRGRFENREQTWLRWQDAQGHLIPTGRERAEAAEQRAEQLAARLRQLGVDPDQIETELR